MSVKKLEKMVAVTMKELAARKALPKFANSAARRYAADYIVKRSVFAPFFPAIGITKGCQIARAFDDKKENPIEFFRIVVKCFFINWYRNNNEESNCCISFEKVLKHLSWKSFQKRVNCAYKGIIVTLRTFQLYSRGIPRKIDRTAINHFLSVRTNIKKGVERIQNLPGSPEERILRAILRNYKVFYPACAIRIAAHILPGSPEERILRDILREDSFLNPSFAACAIPIAAHILSCKHVPAYLSWLDDHYDGVIDCLVNRGEVRAWLKEIAPDFSMEIPARPEKKPQEQQMHRNNRQRRLCTLQNIEEMAIVQQDRLERMIKIFTACEYVELSAWEDHLFCEELLSKINL